jgi:hypothetical protein
MRRINGEESDTGEYYPNDLWRHRLDGGGMALFFGQNSDSVLGHIKPSTLPSKSLLLHSTLYIWSAQMQGQEWKDHYKLKGV